MRRILGSVARTTAGRAAARPSASVVVTASQHLAQWMAKGPAHFRPEALGALDKISIVLDAAEGFTAEGLKPVDLWLQCHQRALIWQEERQKVAHPALGASFVVFRREEVFGDLCHWHDNRPHMLVVPGFLLAVPSFFVWSLGSASMVTMVSSCVGAVWLCSKLEDRVHQLCDDNAGMWTAVADDVSGALGVPSMFEAGAMAADWKMVLKQYAEFTAKEERRADTEADLQGEFPWARETFLRERNAPRPETGPSTDAAHAVMLAATALVNWDASEYSYKALQRGSYFLKIV